MKKSAKIFCCDNAGKNKTPKENCMKNSEEENFEFTSTGTPHQNVVVEQVFATLYSRIYVMMMHVGLH